MLTNSMAHKYQRTNKCKKNHCYNQSCGWFRYFLELCQWRAECNTIQLISLLKLSSDSITKGTLMQKKKISMLGLVHGWIDSLYYPIPLQWVYLHWPLKTRPFLLFLGLSKGNLSSSCETIILRNKSHGKIIRVCMGKFMTAFRNTKIQLKRTHFSELNISRFTTKYT